jgi:aryl-alcohol dehydrogenase-like predicted oxidoreductase
MDFPIVDKECAWTCIEAMRGIARKHTTSVARVALAWMLSKGLRDQHHNRRQERPR